MNMEAGERGGFVVSGRANKTRKQEVAEALATITEHHLVDERGLEMLGEGGTRIAFVLKDFPNHVAKVEREALMKIINSEAETSTKEELRAKQIENHEQLERVVASRRQGEQTLRNYFGSMVLRERIGIMNIPVNYELVKAVGREAGPLPAEFTGIREVEAIVSLQDKAPAAVFGRESRGIKIHYLEDDITDVEQYTDLNSLFLDCVPWEVRTIDMEKVMDMDDTGLQELLDIAQNDESLQQLLENLVSQAIKLSRETGKMLDFVGKDNISVYKDVATNEWRVMMLDVGMSGDMFKDGCEALSKVIKNEEVDEDDVITMVNALNYTRLVNMLAMELDVPDRLAISTEYVAPHTAVILRIARKLFDDVKKRSRRSIGEQMAAK